MQGTWVVREIYEKRGILLRNTEELRNETSQCKGVFGLAFINILELGADRYDII